MATIEYSDDEIERIAVRVAAILDEREPPSPGTGWLNTKQAAEYMACPTSRIHDLVQLRALHPEREGKRLLFRRSDLDLYIESGALRPGRRRVA